MIILVAKARTGMPKRPQIDEAEDETENTVSAPKKKAPKHHNVYTCEHPGCKSMFKSRDGMLYHRRWHTGENPYVCEYPECDYACKSRSSLGVHKRYKHTGERPHKCTFEGCSFAAVTKAALRTHNLRHSGERAFKCDFPECSYAAQTKHNLNLHKGRKHQPRTDNPVDDEHAQDGVGTSRVN